MDDLFDEMRQAADHAGDLIAVVISEASVFGIEAPQLLSDCAWELWLTARTTKAKELPWPRTFIPTAGSRDMDRRRFLAGVVTTAGAVISEVQTTPPTTSTLAILQASTEQLRATRANGGARATLGPAIRHVQAIDTATRRAPDALKRDFLIAHGDALTLLAWLYDSAGLAARARRCGTAALRAANDADHGELAAYALGVLALFQAQHLHDPQDGLKLIEHGQDKAGGGWWHTRAWLAVNEAEMRSLLGERSNTLAALDRAHILFDGAAPPSDAPWFGPHGSLKDVDGYHGACALRLGDAAEALTALNRALDQRGGADSPRAGNALIDLGGAYALDREPEAACTVFGVALDRIAEWRSVTSFGRLGDLRPLLDPWQGEPFVRELDERIAATAAAL